MIAKPVSPSSDWAVRLHTSSTPGRLLPTKIVIVERARHEQSIFQELHTILIRSLLVCCVLATAHAETARKIVGYYYGKGRPDYQLARVPVQRLTHLIYSHAVPTAQGECEMAHPDLDIPNMRSLKILRAQNPGLL